MTKLYFMLFQGRVGRVSRVVVLFGKGLDLAVKTDDLLE
jgi:hypothetical protein